MSIKHIFIIIALLVLSLYVSAQDKIITLENDTIIAQIIEISLDQINYRLLEKGKLCKVNLNEILEFIIEGNESGEMIVIKDESPIIQKTKKAKKYKVEGVDMRVSSFWDLEEYMLKNPFAGQIFLEAKSKRKKANFWGASTIVVFVGGSYIGLVYANRDSSTDFGALFIGGITSLIITPIIGTIALIYKIKSIRMKKKAETAYGIKYMSNVYSKSNLDQLNCSIGLMNNGLGLIINF